MSLGPAAIAWAMALWFVALDDVNLSGMTDVGLISVLPIPIFVAIATLSASFCLSLRAQPPRAWLMVLHIAALIVMLYGITALIQEVPRFESAWKHVGMSEYILRTGSIDPTIDAYHNWPGFFIFAAFLTDVAGFSTPLVLLAWAPVVHNLLYLGPLLMIFRRGTSDERLPWLAVWIFYLTNWIGQDYFSPQAYGYFFYLIILATLLTWFTV
ncbi:MAG: lipopolysaccharide biosynthesis protein, partial [Chloroflexota bacterium]|nr:lipopolysaccharide biosynthesis protein [Chloroflexota bacterium]